MKKIYWAVDAFSQEPRILNRPLSFLAAIAKKHEIEVHPIFILVPNRIDLLNKNGKNSWEEQISDSALKLLQKNLKKVKLKGLMPGRVLIERTGSINAAVNLFLKLGEDEGADTGDD